jgi:hypothetical protein
MKCLEKGNEVLIAKRKKCPVCNYSRKKIAKLNPKSIQTAKYNFVNDDLFYEFYYPLLSEFMNIITNLSKNEEYTRNFYISIFKEQEKQFINSRYSYLKKSHYYMKHYVKVNHPEKKTCSLTQTDMLKIEINDEEYKKKTIINAILKKSDPLDPEKLLEILDKYNYPKELAIAKTDIDFMYASVRN